MGTEALCYIVWIRKAKADPDTGYHHVRDGSCFQNHSEPEEDQNHSESEEDQNHSEPEEDQNHSEPEEDQNHSEPEEDQNHSEPEEDQNHSEPEEDQGLLCLCWMRSGCSQAVLARVHALHPCLLATQESQLLPMNQHQMETHSRSITWTFPFWNCHPICII
ncbi:UNVERIFIED_CONTAM: hypothetical protein K2H54_068747 [Gekko kuhli]